MNTVNDDTNSNNLDDSVSVLTKPQSVTNFLVADINPDDPLPVLAESQLDTHFSVTDTNPDDTLPVLAECQSYIHFSVAVRLGLNINGLSVQCLMANCNLLQLLRLLACNKNGSETLDIGNLWGQQVDDYTKYTILNRCNVPDNNFIYPFSTHKKNLKDICTFYYNKLYYLPVFLILIPFSVDDVTLIERLL
ncbi:hypothetical protein AGLY_017027 [Aphis glycines]|uniref:Uncharacterized protein n=1 Tax=Aphis glycines TaxID=307491 RepID=A0A6G0SWY4_APHGL|nr:hypothetical protein AGLY_017027 [Aphis glycines]